MKIAIIGRSELLFDTCTLLVESGFEIVCIITSKEAPEYKRNADDFQALAKSLRVPYSRSINLLENIQLITDTKADIAISVNFAGIIPQMVIDCFPLGILNAHGGDLPRYKGNACQAWAIINGETEIGLCIHKMIGDELDSGDIIARDYYHIDSNTKIAEVMRWMRIMTPDLFLIAINKLRENPSYFLERQSKNPRDTLRCYPRRPEDGRINWSQPCIEIIRLINASGAPYSGAFSILDGEKVMIHDASIFYTEERICAVPGQVTEINKHLDEYCVAAIDGIIKVKNSVSEEGAKVTTAILKSIRQRFI